MADMTLTPASKIQEIGIVKEIQRMPGSNVTGKSTREVGKWKQIAAVAVAVINTVAAEKIYRYKYNRAKRYAALAREAWDRFLNKFVPCEKKELAELCADSVGSINYDAVVGQIRPLVANSFDQATRAAQRNYATYCVCPDPTLFRDIKLAESIVSGNVVNNAMRRAESRKETEEDLLFNRKLVAYARGRDLLAQSAQYDKAAVNMYSEKEKNLAAAVSGAMEFIGYNVNGRTVEPQRSNDVVVKPSSIVKQVPSMGG